MRHSHNTCDRPPRCVKIIGFVIVGIILALLFGFLFGYFVMLLWNWLMPDIFGLTEITYWQAVGLIILARLIFGSIGGEHDEKKGKKDKCGDWDAWDRNWRDIPHEIKMEFKREFAKEFKKEFGKRYEKEKHGAEEADFEETKTDEPDTDNEKKKDNE